MVRLALVLFDLLTFAIAISPPVIGHLPIISGNYGHEKRQKPQGCFVIARRPRFTTLVPTKQSRSACWSIQLAAGSFQSLTIAVAATTRLKHIVFESSFFSVAGMSL